MKLPPSRETVDGGRSLDHLLARLDVVAARVERAVARRRVNDPDPTDRFRGLYLADASVDALLSEPRAPLFDETADDLVLALEGRADEWEAEGAHLRLRLMAGAFSLDRLDVEILLIALAPDVDVRFESLYGYLHDDVTRRRASIGLALELVGVQPPSAEGRRRLSASGALVGQGLMVVEDPERPLLTRSLRVPDRVSAYLLGDDSLEPAIAELLLSPPPTATRWPPFERALELGLTPIYVHETAATSAISLLTSAIRRAGHEHLTVDLGRLAGASDPAALAATLVREARLRQAVLVGLQVESLLERSSAIIGMLAEANCAVVISGARPWDPGWSRAVPLLLNVPASTVTERSEHWSNMLNGHGGDPDLLRATLAFRMTPVQIGRAARSAQLHAAALDRSVEAADLQAGARSQNAAGLERLSHRIEPRAAWGNLVLPTDVRGQLHELASRARQRERVLDEWGIGGRAVRGRGITALFAGDSGTGKTMSAEVIAGEMGLDLYVIDLSTVIDKYIGETEKNLDRIFAEADRVNGVLLFDEADAIFGKRSEVRDARDRYANVEVAYLLQRMERFDGLAVLTTNLRSNLDDAFTRRIDVIVDFPMPEEEDRLALWRMHLPPELPQSTDLDLAFMAARFQLSGGNIRNVCLTAAFFAAEAQRPLSMADLIRATDREYRKLGRLTVEAEFGPYLALTRS